MGRDELSKRDKWQTVAGRGGRSAEDCYEITLAQYFDSQKPNFEIIRRPNIFSDVYNAGKKGKDGKITGKTAL